VLTDDYKLVSLFFDVVMGMIIKMMIIFILNFLHKSSAHDYLKLESFEYRQFLDSRSCVRSTVKRASSSGISATSAGRPPTVNDDYIDDTAPNQVNIEARVKCRIRQRLDEAPFDLYDEARERIHELMKRDPYKRFLERRKLLAGVRLHDNKHRQHQVPSGPETGGGLTGKL
jgi:Regulator of G protein signaling domain